LECGGNPDASGDTALDWASTHPVMSKYTTQSDSLILDQRGYLMGLKVTDEG